MTRKIKYIHKEARNLMKFEDIQFLMRMSDYIENTENFCNFIKKEMKKFKELKYTSGSADVFINKIDGVVVKIDGTFSFDDPYPKLAIPTALSYNEDTDRLIRIQPIADVRTKVSAKAYNVLRNLPENDTGCDLHCGNVGSYKGNFVVIDW